jgi:hypothetical protein
VAGCIIFGMRNAIGGLLISLTILLPAQQPKPALSFNFNNIGFSANGRWVQGDLQGNAEYPNEVRFNCERSTKLCIEATASYFDGHPHVSIEYFQITKWDASGIVAVSSDSLCIMRNITISFSDKTIVEMRSAKPLDKKKLLESCKFFVDNGTGLSRLVIENSEEWNRNPYGEEAHK